MTTTKMNSMYRTDWLWHHNAMTQLICHHEWREVIDVDAIAIAIACNKCGEWDPIIFDDWARATFDDYKDDGAGC